MFENKPEINSTTDIPCPTCKYHKSLLTRIRCDGNWHMCLSGTCFASFFVKGVELINSVLEVMLARATCTKRAVGAVLLKDNLLTGGYNGPPKTFQEYCNPCPRLNSKSGTDMDKCPAIHAEIHAVLRGNRDVRGGTLYITCGLPCKDCMKELITAGIKKIVSPYPLNIYVDRADGFDSGATYNFSLAYQLMRDAGIEYIHDERITKGSTAYVYVED